MLGKRANRLSVSVKTLNKQARVAVCVAVRWQANQMYESLTRVQTSDITPAFDNQHRSDWKSYPDLEV